MRANALAPRRVSRLTVVGIIAGLALMIAGSWYLYRRLQKDADETKTPAVQEMGTRPRASRKPLGHSPPPVEVVKGEVPVTHTELNGLPPVSPSLVDRVSSFPSQVVQQVAPSRAQTQPNPAIAIKRKALAESRKTPLVVINTGAKADSGASTRSLQPGWKIPFFVESAIHSDIGGEFVGRVRQTVYASGAYRVPLIPAGATVLGSSKASQLIPGNERLPLASVTLSIPGMKPIDLGSMPMTDEQGQLGMVDDIDHHYLRQAFGVIAAGTWGGASRVIQSESRNMGSAGEFSAGMTQSANRAVDPQIQQLYSIKPTIRVYRGGRGYILVTKELPIPEPLGGTD